jgi:hypothetical protein
MVSSRLAMSAPTVATMTPLYVPQWMMVRKMKTMMSMNSECERIHMRVFHLHFMNHMVKPRHTTKPISIMSVSRDCDEAWGTVARAHVVTELDHLGGLVLIVVAEGECIE